MIDVASYHLNARHVSDHSSSISQRRCYLLEEAATGWHLQRLTNPLPARWRPPHRETALPRWHCCFWFSTSASDSTSHLETCASLERLSLGNRRDQTVPIPLCDTHLCFSVVNDYLTTQL